MTVRAFTATAALALALVAPAGAQAQGEPKAPGPKAAAGATLPGFGWFAELAGACWKGTYPDNKTSDTQCYLVQYQGLMRGSIRIAPEGAAQPVFEGDAVFARDSAVANRLIYTQWGTGGIYATGTITFEGETLVFLNRQPDGKDATVRSVWRRLGPDGFRVTRQRNVDSSWVENFSVDYRRAR